MPPRRWLPGRIGLVRGIVFSAFVCGAAPLVAQEQLPLLRDYPGSGPFTCPAPGASVEPSPQQRAQAGQLASEADNAVVLGDYSRAVQLLERASELDPSSADVAYSHARALETLEQTEEAMFEYCRAIALGSDDVGIVDARSRLDDLDDALRARISPNARQRFDDAVVLADGAYYDLAVAAFSDALDERPDWPEALYNRGVVYEEMGLTQESVEDYRQYLALRPEALDTQAADVAQRIGMLEGLEAIPTPSPGNTLAFGVLFPGMGQYYSGRNTMGTLVLGTAFSAIAAGLTYRKVTVRCLSTQPGSDCPPEDIVDETTERPLLGPALGVAALVTVGGAVEAWIRARQQRAEQESGAAAADDGGFDVSGPSLSSDGSRMDLNLIGLRFR